MKVYFAAPLFTSAERRFNEDLCAEMRRLCPTIELFCPQDCDNQFQGQPDFAQRMYDCLIEALDGCELVIAILDGADSDSGTCIEMGYARAQGKRIIGVRTDFRDGEIHGVNIMTAGICSAIIKLPSLSCTIREIAEKIVKEISSPSM